MLYDDLNGSHIGRVQKNSGNSLNFPTEYL